MLPVGTIVIAIVYVNRLQKLSDAIREKQPRRSTVHLLHDSARQHVASDIHQKIPELDWDPIIHPPYLPELASLDYHLFPLLKLHLRGKNLDKYDNLRTSVDNLFASRSPEFLAEGISDMPNKQRKIIDVNGQYIVDS